MTDESAATPHCLIFTTAAGVEWRRSGRDLWVGRRDGSPIGQIERRRRYIAIDADILHCGHHPSFAEAEAALLRGLHRPERSWTLTCATVLLLGTALLVVGLGYEWALALLQD